MFKHFQRQGPHIVLYVKLTDEPLSKSSQDNQLQWVDVTRYIEIVIECRATQVTDLYG